MDAYMSMMATAATAAKWGPGARLEAKLPGWKQHYSGTVQGLNPDGTLRVRFDDGEVVLQLNPDLARPEPGAASGASFSAGDKVEAKITGWKQHYPGVVEAVNDDGSLAILFEDGERQRRVRPSQCRLLERSAPAPAAAAAGAFAPGV